MESEFADKMCMDTRQGRKSCVFSEERKGMKLAAFGTKDLKNSESAALPSGVCVVSTIGVGFGRYLTAEFVQFTRS